MNSSDYTTIEYRKREFARTHGVQPNALLVDPNMFDFDGGHETAMNLKIVDTEDSELHLTPILL